jgi:hypothetical protein
MSKSEIARILPKIHEEEVSARRALSDPAITAKHQFITARSENISRHVHTLAQMVGSENEAMQLHIAVQEQIDGNANHVPL